MPVNSDGSTNNLPHYFWYCRDSQDFTWYFMFYFIWALISGTFSYYLAAYGFGSIVNQQGHVNDYFNSLVVLVHAAATVFHIQICLETFNFDAVLVVLYLVSWGMLFVTTNMNDNLVAISVYYKS